MKLEISYNGERYRCLIPRALSHAERSALLARIAAAIQAAPEQAPKAICAELAAEQRHLYTKGPRC